MTTIVSGSSITFNDNTTQNTSAYGGGFAFRNRIINGDCRIDQRNAGASTTPTTNGNFTVDRWLTRLSTGSKYSIQQNAGSVTPPTGFTNYVGITSLSAYTVAAGDYFAIEQRIEGYNVSDLDFGKATAKTVTLSFKVRSSLTGTFGGAIGNDAFDRSYAFSYTISLANTWTDISVTIPGDTSGTWLTTNGTGLRVWFGFGVGATYSGTSGVWTAAGLISVTGATSVVGTNGATFYITGVQLEKGSTATSFDYRPYGQELALCQRYYSQYKALESTGENGISMGVQATTTQCAFSVVYPVTMRAKPTIAANSLSVSDQSAFTVNFTLTGTQTSSSSAAITGTHSSNGSQGRAIMLVIPGNTTSSLTMSAEL